MRAPGRAAERARDAVPRDPRAQFGELVARIAPAEHVEHVLEQLSSELGERVGADGDGLHLLDRHRVHGHHGHDLLGEHVERVAGDDGLLDEPVAHALARDRGHHQVAAELREHAALRRLAHLVAGPPDALQAAGDRVGRLDLHDEIDGAHVDAELEAAGGDERGQRAGLERVLDLEPLLAGDRAVVGRARAPRRRAR